MKQSLQPQARCRGVSPVRRIVTRVILVLLAMLCAPPASSFAKNQLQKPPPQIGRFIHVTLPITGQTFERTRRVVRRALEKANKENARLVLVFEFDAPKGQKEFGRGSDFGAAHDLASFISSEELGGVRTVAYLPDAIEGHAVLPVIACQEIIMAKDATIGAAGIDETTITPTLRSAYTEIAGRRRTVPVVVALGMLDRTVEVLQVATEAEPEFVTPDGLEKLKKEHTTKEPIVVKRAGERGEFSGSEARRLGLVRYLAADRRNVAQGVGTAADGRRGRPVARRRLAGGPHRSERPHPRRFGQPGAAGDRRPNPRAQRKLHLSLDRQPRRPDRRGHAAGELSGVRPRPEQSPHGGLRSRRGPLRRGDYRAGVRSGGGSSADGARRIGGL